jgi:hypothetical protein
MYNIFRIGFVFYHFKIHPFEIKNIWIALIAGICLSINYFIPYAGNLYMDAAVRTLITGGLFMGIVLFLKISPDINSFIEDILRRWNLLKKETH